jgi:hypothetical protein
MPESSSGKRMKKLRQSTVEPVFGTLINYGAMRKLNTRGIDLAHKSMLMAAIAHNLKKYMKYNPRIVNLMRGIGHKPLDQSNISFFRALFDVSHLS